MRVLLCSLWIGVALAALVPRRAAGQSASARASQYVDDGIAAQRRGEYDAAIDLYQQAYQLVPHPVLIFDMAQAHRLAGDVEQALALYRKYLALDPDGSKAKIARQLITDLEGPGGRRRSRRQSRQFRHARARHQHRHIAALRPGGARRVRHRRQGVLGVRRAPRPWPPPPGVDLDRQ